MTHEVTQEERAPAEEAPERGPRRALHRELIVVASLIFASSAIWAISQPLMSAPDEPAHATKAAGVWQGVLLGTKKQYPPNPGEKNGPIVYVVDAPTSYASANGIFMCFALKPEVTADCAPDLADSGNVVKVETAAGSYPPLYYAIVGWPSRLFPAGVGLYVMRLWSALVATFFFTVGFWALRRVASRSFSVVALVVAVTPQVMFLNGSISPNSLEVAAGFAVWGTMASLILEWDKERHLDRTLLAASIGSSAVLINTRPLSPVFFLMIVAIVVAYAGWRRFKALATDKRWWGIVATIGVSAVPALLWALQWGQAGAPTGGGIISTEQNVVLTLAATTDDWFSQMIAQFGWLDVGPVLVAVWIWLVLAAILVALAAGTGTAWRSTVLVALVGFVAFAPVILQYPEARNGHVLWQGRYFLVIAVGVAVLAAITMAGEQLGRRLRTRLFTAIGIAAGVGVVASHMSAMRRYVVGTDGRLDYLRGGKWSPPLPSLLLLCLTVAVAGSVAVLVNRVAVAGDVVGTDEPPGDDPPARPDESGEGIDVESVELADLEKTVNLESTNGGAP